jgi:hypothetical protein
MVSLSGFNPSEERKLQWGSGFWRVGRRKPSVAKYVDRQARQNQKCAYTDAKAPSLA